ncbi:MAG: hypothetical protein GX409_10330 [candidate division Zixibacteria bacterium]|nr:hypothetical protein [candidate division Zixibacteria bacterium]
MKHVFKVKLTITLLIGMALTLSVGQVCFAQPETMVAPPDTSGPPAPQPPTNLRVEDEPNDFGHGLKIRWNLSADDGAGLNNVVAYELLRSDKAEGPFTQRAVIPKGISEYSDKDETRPTEEAPNPNFMDENSTWYYQMVAIGDQQVRSNPTPIVSGTTRPNWILLNKIPILIVVIIFTIFLLVFISSAKKGKSLYIRPLAGINAVDDAIGRATEMGKPILYILGLGTAGDIATIAGFTILARVAKRTAEYQTKVIVPVQDPVVLVVAQETVRTAYLEAGRPDQYNPDNVFFVTSMQFPYVAAVNGIMLRERPATNFYMGVFYAESLILAETGNVAGSIQIAGTDQISQLPFFVAATDYTLIGEELYAASAYLSQEPVQMGTLKAQDYTKAIAMAIIVLGIIAITAGWPFIRDLVTINL